MQKLSEILSEITEIKKLNNEFIGRIVAPLEKRKESVIREFLEENDFESRIEAMIDNCQCEYQFDNESILESIIPLDSIGITFDDEIKNELIENQSQYTECFIDQNFNVVVTHGYCITKSERHSNLHYLYDHEANKAIASRDDEILNQLHLACTLEVYMGLNGSYNSVVNVDYYGNFCSFEKWYDHLTFMLDNKPYLRYRLMLPDYDENKKAEFSNTLIYRLNNLFDEVITFRDQCHALSIGELLSDFKNDPKINNHPMINCEIIEVKDISTSLISVDDKKCLRIDFDLVFENDHEIGIRNTITTIQEIPDNEITEIGMNDA